jgi:hypothetical protein
VEIFRYFRPVLLSLVIASSICGIGVAAELSQSDYAYLASEYGLRKGHALLDRLTSDEQAHLHALITAPQLKDFPGVRDSNVADYLFELQAFPCAQWHRDHPREACPAMMAEGGGAGARIARDRCLACHLTGTLEAPSFFKLAMRTEWNEKTLGETLAHGHRMSPIILAPDELTALTAFIEGLRQ